MERFRFTLAVVLATGIGPLAPHATRPQGHGSDAEGPRTDHALGVYDQQLRRVVLIGSAGDPGPGDRDRVWSWSGTRWEPLAHSGPAGRVNAAAAYEARRGKTIVAGGSRKTGAKWEVVADSWAGDRNGWQPIPDIDSRDHQSLVENGRGGVLMFGGIPADRSGAWPTDTWELQDEGWKRVASDGPAGRGRTALAYDVTRRQVVLFGGVSAPSGPNQQQVFLADTGSGRAEDGSRRPVTARRGDTPMGWCSTSARGSSCSTAARRRTATRR